MPSPVVGLIGASIGGSAISAGAASDAADAQERSAREQVDLQREIYNDTTGRFQPYYEGGNLGWDAYLYEMGLGDAPTIGGTAAEIQTITENLNPKPLPEDQQFGGLAGKFVGTRYDGPQTRTRYSVNGQLFDDLEAAQAYANENRTGGRAYGGFKETPGYQFQLAQGMDALQSTAAARGNLLSGATMQGALDYSQGLANQEYNNYLNRLAGIGASGQAAAGNQANIGANYAANAGNALASVGNAQAAGAIGTANAWSNGLNNLSGAFGYMNGSGGGGGNSNWLFGGNSWG